MFFAFRAVSRKVLRTYKVIKLKVKLFYLVHATRCKLMKFKFTSFLVLALSSWWPPLTFKFMDYKRLVKNIHLLFHEITHSGIQC